MKEQVPFDASEIDDVRIIIKAKGKHWSILPKEGYNKKAKLLRILALEAIINFHDIVSTALEDINPEKLKDGKV